MRRLCLLVAVILVAGAAAAQTTTVLDFELCTTQCAIDGAYTAQGVTFNPNTHSVWGGLGNGDDGNWGLFGTNGSAFLGLNGTPSYSVTISFAAPKTSVSLDVSRSNGSQAGDSLTATAYSGATQVATQTITFGAVNSWTTVTLQGAGIDSVVVTGSGAGFHPFGIDNVVLQGGGEPIPALSLLGLLALGAALAALGALALRRG